MLSKVLVVRLTVTMFSILLYSVCVLSGAKGLSLLVIISVFCVCDFVTVSVAAPIGLISTSSTFSNGIDGSLNGTVGSSFGAG